MALRIDSRPAILGIRTTKPVQSIEQPKAQVDGSLSLSQIRVSMTLPKVTIDQTQAFNESGLKNVEAFSREYVELAKQKMNEGVARRASQGDELASIKNGGNPIAEQAKYNAYEQFNHEFGMVTMPTSGAQIDVIRGELDIQVQEGELSGEIRAQRPILNYQQGKVELYMKQYNSISIRYIGESLDIKV